MKRNVIKEILKHLTLINVVQYVSESFSQNNEWNFDLYIKDFEQSLKVLPLVSNLMTSKGENLKITTSRNSYYRKIGDDNKSDLYLNFTTKVSIGNKFYFFL